LPEKRSSAAITAEPKGAPAAMARLSAALEVAAWRGETAVPTGSTASGAARTRKRPSPAWPISTSCSRSPITTMARPCSPARAWAKAMYSAEADLPFGRATVAPLASAQAPLKASTCPVDQTSAAGSAMASRSSTVASPRGLRDSPRAKANRPIRATAPTVNISTRPGALVGSARNAG